MQEKNNNKIKTRIDVIRLIEGQLDDTFPINYFFNRIDKLSYTGKNDMSSNMLVSAFDTGLKMGLLWQEIIGPRMEEFNIRAREIADKRVLGRFV